MKQSRALRDPVHRCVLFAVVFNPLKACADALLDMEVTGVQGTTYNGEDVYPYYGTADGNSSNADVYQLHR